MVLSGASLLPILGLGVCLRPAWQWQNTHRELLSLRGRVAQADGRAFRHDAQQCQLMLEAAGLLQREFLVLLPVSFDRVELFSEVRQFAKGAGISLQTLQLGSDKALGLGQVGLDVARLELLLRGSGPLGSIGELLERLEAEQMPAGIDQLTLTARADGTFDIVLEIGLYHWTRASAAPQDAQQP
jgi:hypothetical protein